jgi:hypothetical protein
MVSGVYRKTFVQQQPEQSQEGYKAMVEGKKGQYLSHLQPTSSSSFSTLV